VDPDESEVPLESALPVSAEPPVVVVPLELALPVSVEPPEPELPLDPLEPEVPLEPELPPEPPLEPGLPLEPPDDPPGVPARPPRIWRRKLRMELRRLFPDGWVEPLLRLGIGGVGAAPPVVLGRPPTPNSVLMNCNGSAEAPDPLLDPPEPSSPPLPKPPPAGIE
jgi:hypothetical protein